jgi:hypothetical protein
MQSEHMHKRPLLAGETTSFVVALAFASALGCSRVESHGSSERFSLEPTYRQSAIQLLDLEGHRFALWPAAEPPVTVIVFTRSDCPISNRLAPEIVHLYQLYHPRDVEFYLVYVDPGESPEAIRQHLRDYSYPCPGLRDPSHTLVQYCHATTTPEAVVFDRGRTMTYRGRINNLYEELGRPRAEATTHELADAIESTMQGLPVAIPRTRAVGCLIADLRS